MKGFSQARSGHLEQTAVNPDSGRHEHSQTGIAVLLRVWMTQGVGGEKRKCGKWLNRGIRTSLFMLLVRQASPMQA